MYPSKSKQKGECMGESLQYFNISGIMKFTNDSGNAYLFETREKKCGNSGGCGRMLT
jgi:hypothetical protein